MSVTISLDAMGGDLGIRATVPAAIRSLKAHPSLRIILVGLEANLVRACKRVPPALRDRVECVYVTQVVEMDESPAWALKRKKNSSMRVAIDLVKQGRAHACVSSGNTGALMATARFVLKTIPGIDRPAIVYAIPGIHHETGERVSAYMLDLGANVDCTVDHLVQFALMGSVLAQNKIQNPRVALLNIGEEDMKGLTVIKEAAVQLSNSQNINYVGFVEGNDIFTGKADVIVCDGFIGNIALKTMEGAATFIGRAVKGAIKKSWWSRFLAIFAIPILLKVKRELDLNQYNGASLLGLNGIVIKSHGRSDAQALCTAISEAVKEVEKQVQSRIRNQLQPILGSLDGASE